MNIREERRKAEEILRRYDEVQSKIGDEYPTYEAYVDENGGVSAIEALQARDTLAFLDKVEEMASEELDRIAAIPSYKDDMREVKDIKDKYGFSWNQVKALRAGVDRGLMTVKEAREYLGLNKTQFCRKYSIPSRTLDSWESEERTPAGYFLKLLNRCVLEDK